MADLLISNLDSITIERLNALATIHGQTLESEVKNILQEAATDVKADAWAAVDRLRKRLAESGRHFSDSAEMIREDRER
jgi:plasmid stability protein